MEQAGPLGSADQRLLRQHLDRQWARALQATHGAPRLKALLTRWQARGIHLAMAQILAAHAVYADPHAVHLLRSAGSRSIAVYNWLCATKIYRVTRCAALRLEPAWMAHAVCHRGACTDRLLEAIDLREPLRAMIRQGFGLSHGEIRYLNRVVGAREISAERFEILIRHVVPLPPQARPTTFNGVVALAEMYNQLMRDSAHSTDVGQEIAVFVSLVSADQAVFVGPSDMGPGWGYSIKAFDRKDVLQPEIVINADTSIGKGMRPTYDLMCQAAGYDGSTNYGKDGEWRASQ
ncbi:hypothetical protein [Polaromonas sp. C04]|uniref:hypothetical protein n=1 Tax=Polaromonas sp. C04 TaxID=1945857 RepID=UPI000984AFB4|nr:hypothetical protein [Polaromonas sp. C04]OOG53199.1 hypothetical protein B0E49_12115 [Polaromonas sp. C04]